MRSTFHGLLALVSGAAVLLCVTAPRSVAAQTSLRHHHASTLGADIQEVRGSPFHARSAAASSTTLHLLGHLAVHPPQEVPQAPATDSLPSFRTVFVPTLAATYLADLVGFWAAVCWDSGGGDGCIDSKAINLALAITVPVAIPAYVAGGVVDRMLPAFLGSTLGTMAAVVSVFDSWPALLVAPAIDAAVTTLLTLALHDLGN